jgi:hypothetical protein
MRTEVLLVRLRSAELRVGIQNIENLRAEFADREVDDALD